MNQLPFDPDPRRAQSDADPLSLPLRDDKSPQPVAGKSNAAHVQYKGVGKGGGQAVHDAASQGVDTPASALPHRAAIQRSFGKHDISEVQAHTGTQAAATAQSMGAQAYTAGNHVVLDDTSLHTAAHEAAHVVQQQSGSVQLKDGVGRTGDTYEVHADKVADKVVAGQSAESVLDQMAGDSAGPGSAAVQAKGGHDRLGIAVNEAVQEETHERIGVLEAEDQELDGPIAEERAKQERAEAVLAEIAERQQALEVRVDARQLEITRISRQVESKNVAISGIEQQIHKTEAGLHEHESQRKGLGQDLDAVNGQIQTTSAAMQEGSEHQARRQQAITEVEDQLRALDERIALAQRELEGLREQLAQVKAQQQQTSAESEPGPDAVTSGAPGDGAGNNNGAQGAGQGAGQDQIVETVVVEATAENLRNELELVTRARELEQELAGGQDERVELSTQLDGLNAESMAWLAKHAELLEHKSQLEERARGLTGAIEELDAQIDRERAALGTQGRALEEARSGKDELLAQSSQLAAQQAVEDNERHALEQRQGSATGDRDDAQRAIGGLQDQKRGLAEQLAGLRGRLTLLEREVGNTRVQYARTLLIELRRRIADVRADPKLKSQMRARLGDIEGGIDALYGRVIDDPVAVGLEAYEFLRELAGYKRKDELLGTDVQSDEFMERAGRILAADSSMRVSFLNKALTSAGNNPKGFMEVAMALAMNKGRPAQDSKAAQQGAVATAMNEYTTGDKAVLRIEGIFGKNTPRGRYLLEMYRDGVPSMYSRLLLRLGIMGPTVTFTFGFGTGEEEDVLALAEKAGSADIQRLLAEYEGRIRAMDSGLLGKWAHLGGGGLIKRLSALAALRAAEEEDMEDGQQDHEFPALHNQYLLAILDQREKWHGGVATNQLLTDVLAWAANTPISALEQVTARAPNGAFTSDFYTELVTLQEKWFRGLNRADVEYIMTMLVNQLERKELYREEEEQEEQEAQEAQQAQQQAQEQAQEQAVELAVEPEQDVAQDLVQDPVLAQDPVVAQDDAQEQDAEEDFTLEHSALSFKDFEAFVKRQSSRMWAKRRMQREAAYDQIINSLFKDEAVKQNPQRAVIAYYNGERLAEWEDADDTAIESQILEQALVKLDKVLTKALPTDQRRSDILNRFRSGGRSGKIGYQIHKLLDRKWSHELFTYSSTVLVRLISDLEVGSAEYNWLRENPDILRRIKARSEGRWPRVAQVLNVDVNLGQQQEDAEDQVPEAYGPVDARGAIADRARPWLGRIEVEMDKTFPDRAVLKRVIYQAQEAADQYAKQSGHNPEEIEELRVAYMVWIGENLSRGHVKNVRKAKYGKTIRAALRDGRALEIGDLLKSAEGKVAGLVGVKAKTDDEAVEAAFMEISGTSLLEEWTNLGGFPRGKVDQMLQAHAALEDIENQGQEAQAERGPLMNTMDAAVADLGAWQLDVRDDRERWLDEHVSKKERIDLRVKLRKRVGTVLREDSAARAYFMEQTGFSANRAVFESYASFATALLLDEGAMRGGAQWYRFSARALIRQEALNEHVGNIRSGQNTIDRVSNQGGQQTDAEWELSLLQNLESSEAEAIEQSDAFKEMHATYSARVKMIVSFIVGAMLTAASLGLGVPGLAAWIQILWALGAATVQRVATELMEIKLNGAATVSKTEGAGRWMIDLIAASLGVFAGGMTWALDMTAFSEIHGNDNEAVKILGKAALAMAKGKIESVFQVPAHVAHYYFTKRKPLQSAMGDIREEINKQSVSQIALGAVQDYLLKVANLGAKSGFDRLGLSETPILPATNASNADPTGSPEQMYGTSEAFSEAFESPSKFGEWLNSWSTFAYTPSGQGFLTMNNGSLTDVGTQSASTGSTDMIGVSAAARQVGADVRGKVIANVYDKAKGMVMGSGGMVAPQKDVQSVVAGLVIAEQERLLAEQEAQAQAQEAQQVLATSANTQAYSVQLSKWIEAKNVDDTGAAQEALQEMTRLYGGMGEREKRIIKHLWRTEKRYRAASLAIPQELSQHAQPA